MHPDSPVWSITKRALTRRLLRFRCIHNNNRVVSLADTTIPCISRHRLLKNYTKTETPKNDPPVNRRKYPGPQHRPPHRHLILHAPFHLHAETQDKINAKHSLVCSYGTNHRTQSSMPNSPTFLCTAFSRQRALSCHCRHSESPPSSRPITCTYHILVICASTAPCRRGG